MFKRITAIIFILMANISLLTIAVIPHHHHHNHVCFQNSHYQIEDEGHDHSNTCNGSENDGKNIPDPCISKIAVVLPSGHEKQEARCTCCTDNQLPVHDLQGTLINRGTEASVPSSTLVAWYIHFTSAYTSPSHSSPGLRAPPSV